MEVISCQDESSIHESEQIKLIVNNADPYLKIWMSLTEIPVSFIELYSKGRIIQNQLRDPSFQLYLPQLIEKEPVPIIERAIINEQVTTVNTSFYPQTIQTTLTQAIAQSVKILSQQEIASVQLDLLRQDQEP